MILTLKDFEISEVRQTNVNQESSIAKDTSSSNQMWQEGLWRLDALCNMANRIDLDYKDKLT